MGSKIEGNEALLQNQSAFNNSQKCSNGFITHQSSKAVFSRFSTLKYQSHSLSIPLLCSWRSNSALVLRFLSNSSIVPLNFSDSNQSPQQDSLASSKSLSSNICASSTTLSPSGTATSLTNSQMDQKEVQVALAVPTHIRQDYSQSDSHSITNKLNQVAMESGMSVKDSSSHFQTRVKTIEIQIPVHKDTEHLRYKPPSMHAFMLSTPSWLKCLTVVATSSNNATLQLVRCCMVWLRRLTRVTGNGCLISDLFVSNSQFASRGPHWLKPNTTSNGPDIQNLHKISDNSVDQSEKRLGSMVYPLALDCAESSIVDQHSPALDMALNPLSTKLSNRISWNLMSSLLRRLNQSTVKFNESQNLMDTSNDTLKSTRSNGPIHEWKPQISDLLSLEALARIDDNACENEEDDLVQVRKFSILFRHFIIIFLTFIYIVCVLNVNNTNQC